MADPKLTFDIVADDSKARKNLKSLEQAGTTTTASIAKGFALAQVGIAAAGKAIGVVTGFVRDSIEASNEQIASVTKLNAALESQGNFSTEVSESIQQYARDMQRVTTIGDEVTIGIAAQIEAMTGLSGDALPKATQAAIQLSKAYGIDLKAATLLVGKELTSTTSALTRYGIQIDKSASQTDQLNQLLEATKSGMAIAEAEAGTYEGRLQQLDNAYGDLQESIGAVITDNQTLGFALGETATFVTELTNDIADWIDSNEAIVTVITKDVLNALVLLAQGISAVITGINEVIIAAKLGAVAIELIGAAASRDAPEVIRLAGELGQLEKALFDTIITGASTNERLNDLRASIAAFTPTVRDGAVPATNDLATGLINVETAAQGAASGVEAAARAVEGFNYQFSIFGDQAAAIESGGAITGVIPGTPSAGGGTAPTSAGGGAAGGGFIPTASVGGGGATFAAAGVRPRGGLPMGGFTSEIISGFDGSRMFEFPFERRLFESPFNGTLFPNAQGSLSDVEARRGSSEATPIYVQQVGGSFSLAEAVV